MACVLASPCSMDKRYHRTFPPSILHCFQILAMFKYIWETILEAKLQEKWIRPVVHRHMPGLVNLTNSLDRVAWPTQWFLQTIRQSIEVRGRKHSHHGLVDSIAFIVNDNTFYTPILHFKESGHTGQKCGHLPRAVFWRSLRILVIEGVIAERYQWINRLWI